MACTGLLSTICCLAVSGFPFMYKDTITLRALGRDEQLVLLPMLIVTSSSPPSFFFFFEKSGLYEFFFSTSDRCAATKFFRSLACGMNRANNIYNGYFFMSGKMSRKKKYAYCRDFMVSLSSFAEVRRFSGEKKNSRARTFLIAWEITYGNSEYTITKWILL